MRQRRRVVDRGPMAAASGSCRSGSQAGTDGDEPSTGRPSSSSNRAGHGGDASSWNGPATSGSGGRARRRRGRRRPRRSATRRPSSWRPSGATHGPPAALQPGEVATVNSRSSRCGRSGREPDRSHATTGEPGSTGARRRRAGVPIAPSNCCTPRTPSRCEPFQVEPDALRVDVSVHPVPPDPRAGPPSGGERNAVHSASRGSARSWERLVPEVAEADAARARREQGRPEAQQVARRCSRGSRTSRTATRAGCRRARPHDRRR